MNWLLLVLTIAFVASSLNCYSAFKKRDVTLYVGWAVTALIWLVLIVVEMVS